MILAFMLTEPEPPMLMGQPRPCLRYTRFRHLRSQSFDPGSPYAAFSAPLNCIHSYPANQVSKSSPGQLSSACRRQFRNRRSRTNIALDLTIAVFIAIPVLVPGVGTRGLAADSQEDRPAPFGQDDNEGKTTLGIDSANGRLEFRHGADGKPTYPEDPCSRPQSSLKRRPRGIHLVDLDGDLALAGRNFPDVEAKESSLGGVRQFADLDVDRLRCALAIEYQGHLGTHVQTRGQDSQLRGIGDIAVRQLHDHVASLQSAGRCRAAGLNARD